MVRPAAFGFNQQTAVNNAFQVDTQTVHLQQLALQEFDDFVTLLRSNKVGVYVIEDSAEPRTPDAVFPNNWLSFHPHHQLFLYPMFAPNRRLERKPGAIDQIKKQFGIRDLIDLSAFEKDEQFLEGTGSMVLDRVRKIAYACLSPRTCLPVLDEFCNRTGYQPVWFQATDSNGTPIYHTNVMMCVARQFVVICLESITDPAERARVADKINSTGKNIVEISYDQMNQFAGNMLQVENRDGELFLVMSSRAYQSLSPIQVQELTRFNKIIHADLSTIENNGGGSARCMMAEIFLPLKRLQ